MSPVPSWNRLRTPTGINGRTVATAAVGVAIGLALGACGDATPSASPSSAAPIASNPAPQSSAGSDLCPEMTASGYPSDLRAVERVLVEAGSDPKGVRLQFVGPGGRELTLLSGVAGELPGGSSGTHTTVRGHDATIRSPGAGTFVARWLEGPEGAPCSQYAVISSHLTQSEIEAVLSGIR